MDSRKLYTILGISKDASLTEIKKAYRKKALEYHPDRHLNDPIKQKEGEENFKKVSGAYEILSDPYKRKAYDAGKIDEFGNVNVNYNYRPNFDAEELKSKAASVNNGWELQALMLKMMGRKLHQHILSHVDFIKIINNSSNDLKIALAYLEKAERPLFRLHSILTTVNEFKRKQIYDAILAEKLLLKDVYSFKEFLPLMTDDKLFNEVVLALVLDIVKNNVELALILEDLSEERQHQIIQSVALQTVKREPNMYVCAAMWVLPRLECSNELQFKIALSLFGFDPVLKPDILNISKKAKFEFYDDAGMVVHFCSAKKPTLKEIIDLQEKEDNLIKKRPAVDCFDPHLYSDETDKKNELFKQKVDHLTSKYKTNTHAAFFKKPDERGMAYQGKPMLFDILKKRSFR